MGDPRSTAAAAVPASRTDAAGRYREEAEFVGDGERLFAVRHVPLARPVAGVLVCSPICADFMANYHREVGLARMLAARGVAVQRFHYRGTGNSDGDPAAVTLESLCEDARLAAATLRDRTGVRALGLVGTRWGALVAASISERFPAAPMVFWEPVTDADTYFREARRARLMRETTKGNGGPPAGGTPEPPPVSAEDELARHGVIDLLGYPVYRALYDSARERTLAGVADPRPHPLLVVQLRHAKRVTPAYESLVAALRASAYTADVAQAAVGESWWFHSFEVPPFQPLLAQTVGWLEAHVPESAQA